MQQAIIPEHSGNTDRKQYSEQTLLQFTKALDAAGIEYCCWSSMDYPFHGTKNTNFFDVLIKSADRSDLHECILNAGFKEIHFGNNKTTGRTLNYLGFNSDNGELFYFRILFRLIVGVVAAKEIFIPIENLVFESTESNGHVKTCSAEIEFILFVFSQALKYSSDLSVSRAKLQPSEQEIKRIERLEAQVNTDVVDSIIRQFSPSAANEKILNQCLAFLKSEVSAQSRIQTYALLRKHLLHSNDHSSWLTHARMLWQQVTGGLPWVPGKTKQHTLARGMMVAIVGSDGAGKSTAITNLYEWISGYCRTVCVHLGKPPHSIATFFVHTFIRAGRLFDRMFHKQWFTGRIADTNVPLIVRYLLLVRLVLTARDRQKAYLGARKLADSGVFVICDRFPLSQLKLMDGPRAEQLIKFEKQPGKIAEILINMEKKYYTGIQLPELLIVLRVDPEVAVQRRSDENIVLIRPRAQEVWDTDWRGTSAHVVDANQMIAEINSQLKALVWAAL